jgi:hypothetical protein
MRMRLGTLFMHGLRSAYTAVIGKRQGKSRLVELDVNGDNIKMNTHDAGCESGF